MSAATTAGTPTQLPYLSTCSAGSAATSSRAVPPPVYNRPHQQLLSSLHPRKHEPTAPCQVTPTAPCGTILVPSQNKHSDKVQITPACITPC
jgi:hypothetical protein